jgi:hypothetical protein
MAEDEVCYLQMFVFPEFKPTCPASRLEIQAEKLNIKNE